MPLHLLNDRLWFPPVEDAMDDGLLAMGGDVSPDRLLLAYHQGIFPWYNDDLPLWWAPDPRFVLFPDELRIHKSMQSIIRKGICTFTATDAHIFAGQTGCWNLAGWHPSSLIGD